MRTLILIATVALTFACSSASDTAPRIDAELQAISQAELDTDRFGNERVIKALANAGSDLTKPHDIEYHFMSEARAGVESLKDWGAEAGYSVANEGTGDGYFYVDLIKATVPELELISADSALMLQAAATYGCEYDGWGCSVVN